MRILLRVVVLPVLAAIAALSGGCEGMPKQVTARFAAPPSVDREIPVERTRVFAAVEEAFRRMGYTISRSAAAQGEIVARSEIRRNEGFKEGVQYEFVVHVIEFGAGESRISVWLSEHTEGGPTPNGLAVRNLRSHGLYDSLFEQVNVVLGLPATEP